MWNVWVTVEMWRLHPLILQRQTHFCAAEIVIAANHRQADRINGQSRAKWPFFIQQNPTKPMSRIPVNLGDQRAKKKNGTPPPKKNDRNPSPEEQIRFIRAADGEEERRRADNTSVPNRRRKFGMISAAVLGREIANYVNNDAGDRYLPAPLTQRRTFFFSSFLNGLIRRSQ